MTRHGVIQPQAAGAQPSAKEPRASMMIIEGYTAAPSRLPRRHHHAEAQRSGPSASISVLLDDGRATADISRKSKSP